MSLEIIKSHCQGIEFNANPGATKPTPQDIPYLDIAEFFCDTIQGENFVGWPAAFLRLQHCTMNCHWCDTSEVWRYGNPYTFSELFFLMEQTELIRKFKEGQILVLTGGSPLKQQDHLVEFLKAFVAKYRFQPIVEIENECVIMPTDEFRRYIYRWNNSPKLRNSGNLDIIRYQPKILQYMGTLPNSWFKFVIMGEYDWQEIKQDFLETGFISKDQIVLMPEGATREQLKKNQEKVVEIAIRENVRYTPREHVMIWDRKTGV